MQTDQTARTYKCFTYSIVAITRLHDNIHFGGKFARCTKVCGLFFLGLCFSSADWLSGQTPTMCALLGVLSFSVHDINHINVSSCVQRPSAEQFSTTETKFKQWRILNL